MEQMKTENIQVKTRMITLNCTIQWKNSENNVPEQEYSILSKFQVPALQYYCQRYTKKRNLRNIHDTTYHVVGIKLELVAKAHPTKRAHIFFLLLREG